MLDSEKKIVQEQVDSILKEWGDISMEDGVWAKVWAELEKQIPTPRCDGCKYWDGEPNSGGVGYCDKGVVLETGARSFTVPPDFCCRYWTAKEVSK